MLAQRSRKSAAPASLFEEIYRPARPPLPDPVTIALLALEHARERYRREHAGARRAVGAPTVAPDQFAQTP